MSLDPPKEGGTWVPTGQILDKQNNMEVRMAALETTVKMYGLLVAPLLSTVAATLVSQVIGK